ncbi:MAG: MlaD family protein [Solirubrobacteraceae bacterium]|nr:MlaD family protein [Solirubrobacteraceae bacterium]
MSARATRLRRELRGARRPLAVLVLAVLLAVAAAAAIVSRENVLLPGEQHQTVRVAVRDAKGVVPGRVEVRWAGVPVGRVTDVELRDGAPVLTAVVEPDAVDGDPTLHRDARMALRPQTALNDMVLDVLDRGTPARGRLDEHHVLPAGRTSTPVDAADVLNLLPADRRERLRTLLDDLAAGLADGGGEDLRRAFAALVPMLVAQRTLADTVARRDRTVRALVRDAGRLTRALRRRDRQLTRMLRVGAATAGAVAADEGLDATIAALAPALTRTRDVLGELEGTLGRVRPALRALRPTARAAGPGLRALERLADDATPALRGLRPAVDALRPLAGRLVPTAGALRDAAAGLVPQTPRLDRISAAVGRCELSTAKFFAWTVSVLKFGNRDDRTSSPRGALVFSPGSAGIVADPLLAPAPGCADGKASPR